MSLINKMLQDLEARQGEPSGGQRVCQDLRPVPRVRIRARRRTLGMLLATVTLGAPAAFYVNANLRPTAPEPTRLAVAAPEAPAAAVDAVAAAASEAANQNPVVDGAASGTTETSSESQPRGMTTSPVADAAASVEAHQVAQPGVPTNDEQHGSASENATPAPVRVAKAEEPKPVASVRRGSPESLEKKIRPLTSWEVAEDQYRRAARLLEQGRRAEAESALRAAVAANAGHDAARELLVGLELQEGRWREAEALLKAGLQASPRHYAFAQLLARVRLEHGAEDQALAVLEAAAPHAERDPDFLSFLAALYQRAGRNAEAARTYRQAVALREEDGRAWLGLAIALEAEGQRHPAADAYRRARAVGGLAPVLDQYAAQRLAALGDR